MDSLKRFSALPLPQIAGLAVAICAVIAFLVGGWAWLQTPDYRVLFTNIGDRDGGAVIASLSQMNVPYKLTDGGAIMVPANLVPDTRLKLASQGLPKGGTVGFEILDNQKFGTTQMQEQVNFQRALEGELTKSIQSISAVQGARVHLAIPKPSVFLREKQKPSASVLVSLYPGKALDNAQVAGIVHLVSSSVPDLADANVAVVDATGNLLTHAPEAGGLDPGKLAYVKEMEQGYARRITSIIESIVGAGNVRAEVAADVDFSQTEQTAETFKPNGNAQASAMRSQQSTESSNSTGSASPSGVPGAQANTPTNAGAPASPATAPNGTSSNSATKKDNTVNYELDRTVEVKRMPVGTVRRLSAAIVVNNRRVEVKPEGKADAKADVKAEARTTVKSEPLQKSEIDQITALAREAMGFDEKRGDSLNVVNASFTQPDVLALPDVPMWKDPSNIGTAKEVGKNLLFALVAAYLLFGVLRPAIRKLTQSAPVRVEQLARDTAVTLSPDGAPALAYPDQLQRARQLARDDPKALAGLVRNWVGGQEGRA